MISRVRQVLGVEAGIAELFEKPVLSTLAQHAVHALLDDGTTRRQDSDGPRPAR